MTDPFYLPGAARIFTSDASARTWATEHPQVPGRVVDQAQAQEVARQTFGDLLVP